MWAHDAIRFIERLPHYWRTDPGTNPPRVLSAVWAAQQARQQDRIATTAELAAAGIVFEEV